MNTRNNSTLLIQDIAKETLELRNPGENLKGLFSTFPIENNKSEYLSVENK